MAPPPAVYEAARSVDAIGLMSVEPESQTPNAIGFD